MDRGETSPFFFSDCGHVKPSGENMADFLLDTTTVDLRTQSLAHESGTTVSKIQASYINSKYSRTAEDFSQKLLNGIGDYDSGDMVAEEGFSTTWNLAWFTEFRILFSRAWTNVMREPRTTTTAVVQAMVMGLVTGIVFYDLQKNQMGIRNRFGLLFFAVLNNAFMALQAIVMLFHVEKPVFDRERNAGCYRVSSYYFAKTGSELPLAVFPLLLYTCIFYWMSGLENTAEAFFKTFFCLMVTVITAQSFGLAISTAAPNLKVAQILAPTCTIILMLFGGFYVSTDSLPVWLVWLEAFSFMQYSYAALAEVQFRGTTFACESESFCLSNGTAILEEYKLGGNYWFELLKCLALTVLFRGLSYIFLRFMHRVKLKLHSVSPEQTEKMRNELDVKKFEFDGKKVTAV